MKYISLPLLLISSALFVGCTANTGTGQTAEVQFNPNGHVSSHDAAHNEPTPYDAEAYAADDIRRHWRQRSKRGNSADMA